MGIGLVVLVGYLALSGKLGVLAGLGATQWAWVLLTGVVLAGYVGTWFAALQRAPASVVASVLVLGAVVTGALTAISKGAPPSPTIVGGYILMIAAAGIIAAWSVRAARLLSDSGRAGRPSMPRPTETPAQPAAPVSGPVLFARYAFGPNRLGYCGPDAIEELFGEGAMGGDDRALRELARSFEGAWPYLELIARANGEADPLDRRVVEAYWLGTRCSRPSGRASSERPWRADSGRAWGPTAGTGWPASPPPVGCRSTRSTSSTSSRGSACSAPVRSIGPSR